MLKQLGQVAKLRLELIRVKRLTKAACKTAWHVTEKCGYNRHHDKLTNNEGNNMKALLESYGVKVMTNNCYSERVYVFGDNEDIAIGYYNTITGSFELY